MPDENKNEREFREAVAAVGASLGEGGQPNDTLLQVVRALHLLADLPLPARFDVLSQAIRKQRDA